MKIRKIDAIETGDHVLSLAWSGDYVAVTPATGEIVLAHRSGQRVAEYPAHGLGNGASAFRGEELVTCGFDGVLRFYHPPAHADEVRRLVLGKGWIERAKWNPDGRFCAAALGKTLFIVNREGEVVTSFPDHQTSVADFAWNPANPIEIATVGGGGARMWRIGKAEPFARFDWGGASLLVTWSPDGRWVVTGDQTSSVHLYDFTRDHSLYMQGFETKVRAMDFTCDGRKLATGGGPMVTVWDCTGPSGPENRTPEQLSFHKGDVEAIAWSPDGQHLATGDIMGRVVVSSASGKPVAAFEDEEAISALAWNAEGSLLAVGDAIGDVVIFECGE